METHGIRSQVVALTAASVEPALFSSVSVHDGMRSLEYVYRKPVSYAEAPDLFCLDLYKETDIDRLAALSGVRVEMGKMK